MKVKRLTDAYPVQVTTRLTEEDIQLLRRAHRLSPDKSPLLFRRRLLIEGALAIIQPSSPSARAGTDSGGLASPNILQEERKD